MILIFLKSNPWKSILKRKIVMASDPVVYVWHWNSLIITKWREQKSKRVNRNYFRSSHFREFSPWRKKSCQLRRWILKCDKIRRNLTAVWKSGKIFRSVWRKSNNLEIQSGITKVWFLTYKTDRKNAEFSNLTVRTTNFIQLIPKFILLGDLTIVPMIRINILFSGNHL